MLELKALDDQQNGETEAKRRRSASLKEDPEAVLVSLLLECEKEVRDAKGYIASEGPPLKIVRVRVGETAPKGATFLSRPRGTGVDFTVPVTIKAYTELIKKPIFLNTIRDKIKAKTYNSPEDYLDDMRLLARNTASFNKGAELSWVVQHARFLLEAAEDAVTSRRQYFYQAEDAIRQLGGRQKPSGSHAAVAVGKRKRSAAIDVGDVKPGPAVGSTIEVYWPNYRRWFLANITERSGSNVHLVYDEDQTDQWVNLDTGLKWRVRNSRAAAAGGKSRRIHEPPTPKRRKSSSAVPHADSAVVAVGNVSAEDLDSVKAEMFSKMDDMREGITDVVKNHLSRIDNRLLRSDILQRVLLAVEDCQATIEEKLALFEERQIRLEDKIDTMSKKLAAKGVALHDDPIEQRMEEHGDPVSGGKDTRGDRADDGDKLEDGRANLSKDKPSPIEVDEGAVIEVVDDSVERPSVDGREPASEPTNVIATESLREGTTSGVNLDEHKSSKPADEDKDVEVDLVSADVEMKDNEEPADAVPPDADRLTEERAEGITPKAAEAENQTDAQGPPSERANDPMSEELTSREPTAKMPEADPVTTEPAEKPKEQLEERKAATAAVPEEPEVNGHRITSEADIASAEASREQTQTARDSDGSAAVETKLGGEKPVEVPTAEADKPTDEVVKKKGDGNDSSDESEESDDSNGSDSDNSSSKDEHENIAGTAREDGDNTTIAFVEATQTSGTNDPTENGKADEDPDKTDKTKHDINGSEPEDPVKTDGTKQDSTAADPDVNNTPTASGEEQVREAKEVEVDRSVPQETDMAEAKEDGP